MIPTDLTAAKAVLLARRFAKKFKKLNGEYYGTTSRRQEFAIAWDRAVALDISLRAPSNEYKFETSKKFRKMIMNQLGAIEAVLSFTKALVS